MPENENNVPEDLSAFRIIQHFTMQGEATYDDFQTRVQALKLVAQRLDLARTLEAEVKELKKKIAVLEEESNYPLSDEVAKDMGVSD